MSVASGSSLLQTKNNVVGLTPVTKPFVNHQLNVVPLSRASGLRAKRRSRCGLEATKFFGARLPAALGSEKLHLWQTDGRGQAPKLRVVHVQSALSQVPEKPLGLYDPSFDKDSCGVGFVAELSGESSRKTVYCLYINESTPSKIYTYLIRLYDGICFSCLGE